MKNYSLTELTKILSTPENQPMNTLMEACKQASKFLLKGKEFADAFLSIDKGMKTASAPTPKVDSDSGDLPEARADARPSPPAEAHIQGGLNLYITGVRPINGKILMLEAIKAVREASGELNSAPRMTLHKAKELVEDLQLGDRSTFLRTFRLPDEAQDAVKDLSTAGVQAEIRK
jgi:hypothetical protein